MALQKQKLFFILQYSSLTNFCTMRIDKLIISNRSALQKKYGAAGLLKIQSSIKKLVSADKKRQLNSLLVFVDDGDAIKKVKGTKVTDSTDASANKNAVDALAKYYHPDYFMLLGATDIIPHCRFKIVIPDDDDTYVPSDTPYACDAPFSRNAGDFIAPSRVLGRLPDINGSSDVSYLIALIEKSINWKCLKPAAYNNYFALSVKWWEKSTRISISNIFGDNQKLLLAPPTLSGYSKPALAAKMHFFNCHGGLRTPDFYGQPNSNSDSYPVCFNSEMLKDKISEGTVAVAECCYGGLLYNPYKPTTIAQPICNSYLQNNALAFVGSTTAAYGPDDSQGAADYITQYFFIALKKGASCGRAFLEAQQRFVEKGDVKMDPVDLKTIIQFLLLGDPSVQPVENIAKDIAANNPVKSIVNRKENVSKDRKERRIKLAEKSVYINMVSDAPVKLDTTPRGNVKKEITAVLKEHNFEDTTGFSYGFKKKQSAKSKAMGMPAEYKYHLYGCKKAGTALDTVHVLVMQEVDNKITEVKEYVRR